MASTVDEKAKMRANTQKAADDIDAAQNFFDDKPKAQEKPKPKAEDKGKISALERTIK